MPTPIRPASWWKTCSTPTPGKALEPSLPSGRRNGVIGEKEGGVRINSISDQGRRDRRIGGRDEFLSTLKSRSNAAMNLHARRGPMIYRTVLAFAILASAATFSASAETLEE